MSNSGLLLIKISSSRESLRGESNKESGDSFIAKSTTERRKDI